MCVLWRKRIDEDDLVVALGGLWRDFLMAWSPYAFALNPALDVSQYAHTAWMFREGFFKGTIVAIAQTLDGYLWLGTEFGLLRFDGVRYGAWQPPPGTRSPQQLHSKFARRARWDSLDWHR